MFLYLLISIPFFLLALVIHEYAHGWVANKLGDSTAKHSGRLTFNPMAHIDPVGTVILPLFLLLLHSPVVFGWAKPVPVNFSRLKNPKEDMFWVAIAGPGANFIAALFFASLIKIPFIAATGILRLIFAQLLVMNVALAVFNLLPVPPLDGSRIMFSVLPNNLAYRYIKLEPYGMFILIALLWLGVMNSVIWPVISVLIKILGVSL